MPACYAAWGEIFTTHDSAITHKEDNDLENGQRLLRNIQSGMFIQAKGR